jgi:hypothetical protein
MSGDQIFQGDVDMQEGVREMSLVQPPMLIAGSGRSGTTWVLDVIATTFHLRPIFEPLHPGAVKGASPYAWKYVPPTSSIAGMDNFFEKIFAGDLYSLWTDFRVHPRGIFPRLSDINGLESIKLLRYDWLQAFRQYRQFRSLRTRKRIIVKCIRANLLLGWLVARFDAKVLLLVRHPGAVVESKLRLAGVSWDPEQMLDIYRKDDKLKGLRAGLYSDLLSQDLTAAQSLTLLWCIENQAPMAEAEENGYLLVHYEDLLDQGRIVWDRIAEFFDLANDRWDEDLLYRPSQQASEVWHNGAMPGRSHRNWMERIPASALTEIDEILKATGETVYDAYQPRPRVFDAAHRS